MLQQVCHFKVDVIAGDANAVVLCCLAQPMQTPPFSVEGLGWQWMGQTLRPRLHARPCDPDEHDEHNMWNPMLGLFCHVHVGVFMEA